MTPTEQPPSPGVSEDLQVLAVISPEEIENTATSVDEVVDVVDADAVSNGVTTQQSTTIVFSAEEVNEKYLTDKPVAEATSEAKESSTLRKLLDKAYDLKNNQDPIGDLRQKKYEILAMNFKHQKQRDENN